jgi:hypothetical protein
MFKSPRRIPNQNQIIADSKYVPCGKAQPRTTGEGKAVALYIGWYSQRRTFAQIRDLE